MVDQAFVADVESRFFRTEHDTGANLNALLIWNQVRAEVGLPKIRKEDLATGEEYTQPGWQPGPYPIQPRTDEERKAIRDARMVKWSGA